MVSVYHLDYKARYKYKDSTVGIEVQVELFNGEESTRLMAKIDTGAAYCIFQEEFATDLEIDVTSGVPLQLSTATGTFKAYGHEIDLSCLGYRQSAVVYFANIARNVLGRRGWLDRHQVGIVDHDSTLYLSHYDDSHT